MNDEWMMLHEQRMADRRDAARSADELGLVGMSLLPAAALVGLLCGVLKLIVEQRKEQAQIKAETKCLEELILDATARAQTGKIIPMEKILEVYEHG